MTENAPGAMNATDPLRALEPLLTVREVAKLLKLDRSSAYDLIATGEIAHVRLSPKRIRVKPAALTEYIERHAGRGAVEAVLADKAAV
ncbi:MAG: helix-turn-helix domain-containing protein [Bacillota bacterium]